MRIETRQETVDYEVYVSEDGQYSRTVKGMSGEEKERAKKEIENYEQSAKCVLLTRLKQRNVLGKVVYTCKTQHDDGTPLTEEEKAAQSAAYLLDAIMDDGCACSDYYIFTPRTEEDIKDLYVYLELAYASSNILDGSEGKDYYRATGKVETGKQYILYMHPEGDYCSVISLPLLLKRVEKMCSYFDKLGKAQLKK